MAIFFQGKDREILENIRLDDGKRLLILTCADEPALAVTAIQFESSGLFTDMYCHHHIDDIAKFMSRLPVYIKIGVYE